LRRWLKPRVSLGSARFPQKELPVIRSCVPGPAAAPTAGATFGATYPAGAAGTAHAAAANSEAPRPTDKTGHPADWLRGFAKPQNAFGADRFFHHSLEAWRDEPDQLSAVMHLPRQAASSVRYSSGLRTEYRLTRGAWVEGRGPSGHRAQQPDEQHPSSRPAIGTRTKNKKYATIKPEANSKPRWNQDSLGGTTTTHSSCLVCFLTSVPLFTD
jgi:hypothetical protein